MVHIVARTSEHGSLPIVQPDTLRQSAFGHRFILGQTRPTPKCRLALDRLRQVKLDGLRSEVRKGLDSGVGEKWDATAVKAKARARHAAKPTVA